MDRQYRGAGFMVPWVACIAVAPGDASNALREALHSHVNTNFNARMKVY